MVYIYVLKLEDNKYYVGKSTSPFRRINQHFSAEGAGWTKTYKPIDIHEVYHDKDNYDEDKITIQYMKQYGIENVRGGSFCTLTLSDANKQTIEQMIRSVSDLCLKCGSSEHFANNCDNSSNNIYINNTNNKQKLYEELKYCIGSISHYYNCCDGRGHRHGMCPNYDAISIISDNNKRVYKIKCAISKLSNQSDYNSKLQVKLMTEGLKKWKSKI